MRETVRQKRRGEREGGEPGEKWGLQGGQGGIKELGWTQYIYIIHFMMEPGMNNTLLCAMQLMIQYSVKTNQQKQSIIYIYIYRHTA
jgi:hypothetical protein